MHGGFPKGPDVLVSIEHDLGVAALCRAPGGDLWVTADLDRMPGPEPDLDAPRLDGELAVCDELHAIVAEGGVLPPGASSAHVRDVFGEYHAATLAAGVWLAVLPRGARFRAAPMLFRDGGGSVVRQPQPEGATRRPLDAAGERCPACDGDEWELVVRPRSRLWVPTELTVCRNCGYGVFASPPPACIPDELPAAPPWLRRAGSLAGRAATALMEVWMLRTLRAADFPLYGLSARWEGPRFLASSGGEILKTSTFELAHGDPAADRGPLVLVETTNGDMSEPEWLPPPLHAEETLFQTLDDWEPAAHAGGMSADHAEGLRLVLADEERDRTLARRVLSASRRNRAIPVDGNPVEFSELQDTDVSVAAARIGEVDVSIVCRDVEVGTIELTRVEDVSAYRVTHDD